MKSSILVAIVYVLTYVTGCGTNVILNSATVTPITHQPEAGSIQRTVGLLRRLAILPSRIEFSPADPKGCLNPCDWDQLKVDLAQSISEYLSKWRGYEVVMLDPLVPDYRSVDLPGTKLDELVGQLADFAEQRSTEPPSEDLVEAVRLVTKRAWVDGIVIVRGNIVVTSKVDFGLAFPLAASGYGLLAAIPIQMLRIGTKYEADIFEVKTGRLVWASAYRSKSVDLIGMPPAGSVAARELLDAIEPALPTVMTRTINPPAE